MRICAECKHFEIAEAERSFPPHYFRCCEVLAAPISPVTGKPETDECAAINLFGNCVYWAAKDSAPIQPPDVEKLPF